MPQLAPVKLTVQLDRQTLAQILFITDLFDRATTSQIRLAVGEAIAEHGTRGCRRRYDLAARDAEKLDEIEPDARHRHYHSQRLLWCLEQVDRAFRPRPPRRQRTAAAKPLIEVLGEPLFDTLLDEPD
ncbi:hypothetical protein GA0070616_0078 [Micromonospora nigra]|uniref:Uncharacterized protein n=1 Tax=Micromonospora nigra TaxID=145857 RepID=A0A1C6R7E1_9ACTN|nr:hypothetical protein [Micromonospora nigra]SCL12958.1 hypothetical protein GA0070616_0078 [Micromonospora nigra]